MGVGSGVHDAGFRAETNALPLSTVAFGAYAALIAPVGFVVATTATVASLSVLFGASLRKAVGAALTLSVVLWYLFVWVLGLPLPLGSVWEVLWRP